jgi:hypothetical protein
MVGTAPTLSAMQIVGMDERHLKRDGPGTNFVAFIYEGGDATTSWSVDSYLVTDAELADVLEWLQGHLPEKACYSVGVVVDPPRPTETSDVEVTWVIGADVLNMDPRHWTPMERRIAEGMLARRHRTSIP